MAVDLSKLSEKELGKLSNEIEVELRTRAKNKRTDARKAAEAAAKKHGFSLNELLGPKKGAAKKAPAAPKFKNPKNPDETWSGRGRQPAWYKAALKAGTDPKKLAV